MPTALDQRMDATIAALTAPGGMLAAGSVEQDGRTLPMIAAAPATLPLYFTQYCQQHADRTFLVAGDERLTFAEVHAAAVTVAGALIARHGIVPGDRVGIAMRNSPSWIALYMGILMAGGIATLLNGWWQADELAAAIHEVDCRLIIADPPREARLLAIAVLATPVIAIDDTPPLLDALAPVVGARTASVALPTMTATDPATILFTSGSTGLSKGALSDHRGVVQGAFSFVTQAMTMRAIATADGKAPAGQPATLLTLPLFHVTAQVSVLLQSFALGRKLVLMPRWDAEAAMRLIAAERVTYFIGVPLMSFEILTHPNRWRYDLSTVTDYGCGGAARPAEHVRRLNAEMGGAAPVIGYGLTETNAVGANNWRANYLAKPDSTGRASQPLVEIAILDDAGAVLAQGARGEIGIRSICNFRGYWQCPEATAAAFTAEGYFRTGDIGYLDEDGYLFIVDRRKDIIIRGGENISCQEVEAALYAHPAVAEAAVFGLSDDHYGEVPGAVVQLRDDARLGMGIGPAELQGFLAARIAAFKVPARIWLSAAALPRLGTEKIDKVGLRARYRAVAAGGQEIA